MQAYDDDDCDVDAVDVATGVVTDNELTDAFIDVLDGVVVVALLTHTNGDVAFAFLHLPFPIDFKDDTTIPSTKQLKYGVDDEHFVTIFIGGVT